MFVSFSGFASAPLTPRIGGRASFVFMRWFTMLWWGRCFNLDRTSSGVPGHGGHGYFGDNMGGGGFVIGRKVESNGE